MCLRSIYVLRIYLIQTGVRGRGAVRHLLLRSAPQDHGPPPDDLQDLQQQVRPDVHFPFRYYFRSGSIIK